MLATLPEDIDRGVRMRGNHNAIDCHWDGGQVRIGRYAFNLGRVWVDRENLISAVLQPPINSIGRLARSTGNACHGNALSAKKLRN